MGLRPLVGIRLQVLFHSYIRGSFLLTLALLFTIGHQGVLSLARWAALIHARFHGTGATRELRRRPATFRLRGYRPLWPGFPASSSKSWFGNSVPRPQPWPRLSQHPVCNARGLSRTPGLGSSLFDRLYWGNRCLFPFLQVLRWVSSLRSLPHTMDSCAAHADLPHVVSESRRSPDQRLLASTRGFSQLCHVLRRLLVPRHPHVHPF